MGKENKTEGWFGEFQKRNRTKMVHERGGYRRGNWLVILGFGLLAAGFWAIIAIFGPVLVAEVGYQVRNVVGAVTGNYGMWNAFRLPSLTVPSYGQAMAGDEIGIIIPKIYVREKVIEGVNPTDKPAYLKALQLGVAHAAGTAMPGEPGLGYYFAHSSGMNLLFPQKKAAFYLLGKLEVGDVIYLYRDTQTYEYRVTEKRVTEANDLSFLTGNKVGEQIVLQTCWPIGTSLKRLLVTAERIS